jgi:hypothetical protein
LTRHLFNRTPFALSLSKGRISTFEEGQGFDKLSPNGFV